MASACAVAPPSAPGDFDSCSAGLAADWVRLSPERATFSQDFQGAGQDALDAQLSPQTASRRAREHELARQGLARFDSFPAGPLTQEQRTAAATVQWSLQRALAAAPHEDYNFAFNRAGGLHVRAIDLTQGDPLRRPADVQRYLLRLAQLPEPLDQLCNPHPVPSRSTPLACAKWRGGSAHSEGSALYAERLAIKQGCYEGEPTSLLGALDSQLFRARRLAGA